MRKATTAAVALNPSSYSGPPDAGSQ